MMPLSLLAGRTVHVIGYQQVTKVAISRERVNAKLTVERLKI